MRARIFVAKNDPFSAVGVADFCKTATNKHTDGCVPLRMDRSVVF